MSILKLATVALAATCALEHSAREREGASLAREASAGEREVESPAEKQTAIEEIFVTAAFRAEPLGRLPASVSVVGAEEIAARAAAHLDDVLGAVPNLNFAKGASRARYLQLRGIGERGQFEEPLNSSVGLIVDGVDLSGIGTVAGLFDVEQVEVLRGPQGTLYGANALAGLVHVATVEPTRSPEGRLALAAGTHGGYGVGLVASGPISERARARFVARLDASDGFVENAHLRRDDTDGTRDAVLRGRLALDWSDAARLEFAAGLLDADNGYDAFSLDNTRATLSDRPGRDAQQTLYGTVSLFADAHPRFSLRVHAAAVGSDIAYGYDEDWVYEGFHPWGYSSTDNYLRQRRTATAEMRLTSKPDGARDAMDWTAGLHLLDQSVDLRREYTYADRDFTSDFGMRRYAAFGQTDTPIGAATTLTLGLRLERHAASYLDGNGIAFAPRDTMVGGKIALARRLGDTASLYGVVARGYKAGGFNADGTLDADLRVYEPEALWNYEAGMKVRAPDGRWRARLALFHMRRRDVQIESSLSRARADGSAEFIQYLGNAAEGVNSGVEADVDYFAGDRAVLFARLGLLRAEYREYVTRNGDDYDGREQAHAPSYQLNAGGEFTLGRVFLRVEGEARDRFYFSDNHDFRSNAYRLLHASAGYRGDDWELRLWAKNLTDEDYFVRGFFFGNDPRDGYAARGFTQLGAPRRAGLTLTRSW